MSLLHRLACQLLRSPQTCSPSLTAQAGMLGTQRLWISGAQAALPPASSSSAGLQAVKRWLHHLHPQLQHRPCHVSARAQAAQSLLPANPLCSLARDLTARAADCSTGRVTSWGQRTSLCRPFLPARLQSTMAAAAAPAMRLVGGEGLAAGVNAPMRRQLAWWMAGTAGWVYTMVVLGGVTRLTRSGLSMTEWKFSGERPPMTQADWEAQFIKYRESPEFRLLHSKMTLDEFKFIFWMEYAHRMWGRLLGLAFAVPCTYFAVRGAITRPLAKRLALLFFMGGTQGLVGWWMVRSGLQEPQHEWEHPRVSPYRLAAHLVSAFAIFATLTWTALDLSTPAPLTRQLAGSQLVGRARALWLPFAVLVATTACSGAFVAGMDAGRAYNTWPLMGGNWVPEEYWKLWESGFGMRNFFENTAAVQFDHRTLAATTATCALALWAWVRRQPLGALPRRTVLLADLVLAVTGFQFLLGIWTLLEYVPVHLGSAHQANALNLFVVVLATLHTLRPVQPSATAALLSRVATPLAMVSVGSIAVAVTQQA